MPAPAEIYAPNPRLTNDPQRWRERAAEVRAIAEQMYNSFAIEAMERLAKDYDRWAEWAEYLRKNPLAGQTSDAPLLSASTRHPTNI
jgi:hypothetical protein